MEGGKEKRGGREREREEAIDLNPFHDILRPVLCG